MPPRSDFSLRTRHYSRHVFLITGFIVLPVAALAVLLTPLTLGYSGMCGKGYVRHDCGAMVVEALLPGVLAVLGVAAWSVGRIRRGRAGARAWAWSGVGLALAPWIAVLMLMGRG